MRRIRIEYIMGELRPCSKVERRSIEVLADGRTTTFEAVRNCMQNLGLTMGHVNGWQVVG